MSLEQPSASSPIPLNDAPKPDNDSAAASNGVSSPQKEEPPAPVPAPAPRVSRSNRPSRACTLRAAERLQAAQQQAAVDRKPKPKKEQQIQQRCDESPPPKEQCGANSKIITPLVGTPEPAQLSRWSLRSMWELASILNFLHVFWHLLNIQVEFSAEEFETALLTPNDTLGDIHMPILRAIPPITRMALTHDTWITVLCRKLRDWWHWVADGDLPIIASHGVEIEVYKNLDPGMRVVILKALCDIRVEQEDIRNYIDNSLKHGVQLSAFRKERVGGDSQGINYWYEDDPVIGHRLYREIRKVEVKKPKARGSQVISNATYQWETVATNFEEFQDVSEKLFASKNRTEASLGKKLKNDMLPEIEKVHKRKERLLKKQHREALLLDNFLTVDGLGPGRALRDRKPVTYTFDDYDRSIKEAIKITKQKPPSPEPVNRRAASIKPEASTNGKLDGPSNASPHTTFNMTSPDSPGYDNVEEEEKPDLTDPSSRRRQRPQRYSAGEFVEAVSDNDAAFDSDDDIVGEAVYDEEYLKKRKQRRKLSSSSEGEDEGENEGDEEYRWDEENGEDDEEEDSLSISDESDEPRKAKKLPSRTRRGTKIRSVDEIQTGLRRSRRATRNRINYRQYEVSESETESAKPRIQVGSDERSDSSENEEFSGGSQSQDSGDPEDEEQDMKVDEPMEDYADVAKEEQNPPPEKPSSSGRDEVDHSNRGFLDLNEIAPGSGFEDSPKAVTKDGDRNNF